MSLYNTESKETLFGTCLTNENSNTLHQSCIPTHIASTPISRVVSHHLISVKEFLGRTKSCFTGIIPALTSAAHTIFFQFNPKTFPWTTSDYGVYFHFHQPWEVLVHSPGLWLIPLLYPLANWSWRGAHTSSRSLWPRPVIPEPYWT